MSIRSDGNIRQLGPVGAARNRRWKWAVVINTGEKLPTGSYRRITRHVEGSKADAEDALRMLAAEARKARPKKRGEVITVEHLLDDYLAHIADTKGLAASTIEGYRVYVDRWIVPAIGNLAVDRVTTRHIDDITASMRVAQRAPSSINQMRVVLSGAFKHARKHGLTRENPMELATRVKVTAPRRKIPEDATVHALLRAAAELGPVPHLAIRLAAILGARRGELVGIQWRDVNLEAGTVDVVRALGYDTGRVVVKSTKTADERVGLAVDAETVALMRQVKSDGPWVVSSDGGHSPWSPDALAKQWQKARAAVPGAEKVHLHDLRHWAATLLLDAGVPAHEVARRLGHASANVTNAVYAHARGRNDQQYADHLASRLLG